MSDVSSIGALTAFVAGIISFLSPCVLPLVPGYLSYVAGQSLHEGREQTHARSRLLVFSLSLIFVAGFSTVFIALGASATAIVRLLLTYRYEANIVGGIIILLFGLFMTGLLRLAGFSVTCGGTVHSKVASLSLPTFLVWRSHLDGHPVSVQSWGRS